MNRRSAEEQYGKQITRSLAIYERWKLRHEDSA